MILEFNRKFPKINTELSIDKTVTITEKLLENKIDIAIIAKSLPLVTIVNQPPHERSNPTGSSTKSSTGKESGNDFYS